MFPEEVVVDVREEVEVVDSAVVADHRTECCVEADFFGNSLGAEVAEVSGHRDLNRNRVVAVVSFVEFGAGDC